MSLPYPVPSVFLTLSPTDDIEDKEVDEGDCLGVPSGDPTAVEGEDSTAEVVTVLCTAVDFGRAVVEVIVL